MDQVTSTTLHSFRVSEVGVVNPKLRRMRRVNFCVYLTLLVSATIFLIAYSIFWIRIHSKLNVFETGNYWMLIVFLTSCIVVIVVSIVILTLHIKGFPVHWHQSFGEHWNLIRIPGDVGVTVTTTAEKLHLRYPHNSVYISLQFAVTMATLLVRGYRFLKSVGQQGGYRLEFT
ncbi:uncharacterized protein LOC118439024 isoform X3 [Folsomia candida]|uniref:uncharacterized protein LOC118439024 isoform X3 n=1 Tax=Folsomia candida TaxID=158441 RepID=UPI001604CE83|nr:uncharacterized protein LOC118439024 isoform X3 [Folsomia candida]